MKQARCDYTPAPRATVPWVSKLRWQKGCQLDMPMIDDEDSCGIIKQQTGVGGVKKC